MSLTKTRDRILAAVGGAALLIYILACGPAFSPDDSKVLYPANDPKTGGAVLAVYDRRARTSRALFTVPGAEPAWLGSAWTQDGSRAVVLWAGGQHGDDKQGLLVASIPLHAGKPIRMFSVPELTSDQNDAVWAMPSAVIGSWLFIGARDGIYRIDLEYGREVAVEVAGNPEVIGLQNSLYYVRDLPGADKQTGDVELGRLDPRSLKLSPLYVLAGFGGVGKQVFAASGDGKQLAVLDGKQILVYEDGNLLRTLPVAAAMEGIGAPNTMALQWSRDTSFLYLIYTRKLDNGKTQVGIGEVNASGGSIRPIPLFAVDSGGDGEGVMNLELSHDGKTLATASTYMQTPYSKLAEGKAQALEANDLALYLIDVSSPGRKITKVPIPPLPNVAPAKFKD